MFTPTGHAALGILTVFGTVVPSAFAQDSAPATSGLKPLVYKGCYTSSKPMTDQGPWTYQSPGYCQQICVKLNKPVMGLTEGSNCWCGDLLPSSSSKVSDSQCNTPCQGYAPDMCGGSGAWSVHLTGLDDSVSNVGGDGKGNGGNGDGDTDSSARAPGSASPSPSPTNKPSAAPATTLKPTVSVITKAGGITTVTASAAPADNSKSSPTLTSEKKSAGPNKAAIVAGVVVGFVIVGAVVGGLIFFLMRRKQRALEEEYKQNTANTYIGGAGKTIPTSASSITDSRIEPSVMMQRRQSDGSIADNQDYSRRILKVTNPDGPP